MNFQNEIVDQWYMLVSKAKSKFKVLKCFFILINNFTQNVPSIVHCVYKICFLLANNPNIKKNIV